MLTVTGIGEEGGRLLSRFYAVFNGLFGMCAPARRG
jgi:cystathionine beta-lyase family protein involved in aluminum resistance